MAVVRLRRPFTTRYRQLKRQRNWLVELDRVLDPPQADDQPRPTRRAIQHQVKALMARLEQHAQGHPQDAEAVACICKTLRSRWPRLFACYAWPERYRTNNDLETFFGRLRTRQRQVQGRKSVHAFVLRYGEWAVFIDPHETLEQLRHRFQQFNQAAFDREYARFQTAQAQLQILYRFRHQPRRCLKKLEAQWADALQRQAPSP